MGQTTIWVNGIPRQYNVLTYTDTVVQDNIAALLEKQIELWRMRTFKTWQLWIAIQVAAGAEEICYKGRIIGYDKYSINLWDREADDIHVEFQNGKVQIKTPGGLLSIAAYMDKMSFPKAVTWSATPEQSTWDRQWDWWVVRSKTLNTQFPFGRLPAELRNFIYSQAYNTTIRPFKMKKMCPGLGAPFAIPVPSTSLMLLNRQYYKEASGILFETATFKVNSRPVLRRLTCNALVTSQITNLELSLSHEDFLKLFRWKYDPKMSSHSAKTALVLRYMANLQNLTLDIDAPSRTSVTSLHPTGRRVVCQDKAVAYILGAALPFIDVIKNVKITGYIKTEVKKDFEAFCAAGRKFFETWCELAEFNSTVEEFDRWLEDDGGVALDAEGEEDTDANQENFEWPPVCNCETSCEYGSWKAE
ncbi:hypothetical protein HII31_07394 [Pseudocercospora fuligena]|uniref:Uncharacterized protein n=1 Tax=Pseudocercospora fuligena TaxID=685502 RepID=A0A8H6RF56_9PEZI|nr:hypothetical protein HII31_07394 [Pseudocercospora fuligena]